jgi:hypothetical protein
VLLTIPEGAIPMAVEYVKEELIPPEEIERSPVTPGGRAFSIGELIERWWQDHFPGSAVARDTQAWNTAYAAKEALKRLLKGSI